MRRKRSSEFESRGKEEKRSKSRSKRSSSSSSSSSTSSSGNTPAYSIYKFSTLLRLGCPILLLAKLSRFSNNKPALSFTRSFAIVRFGSVQSSPVQSSPFHSTPLHSALVHSTPLRSTPACFTPLQPALLRPLTSQLCGQSIPRSRKWEMDRGIRSLVEEKELW